MKYYRIDRASYIRNSKGEVKQSWHTRILVQAWSAGHALDKFPAAKELRIKAEANFLAYAYGPVEMLDDPAAKFKALPALPEDIADKNINRIL